MSFTVSLVIAGLILGIATYILYLKWLRSKYPPGPWPFPIIGNLLWVSETPHFDFIKLSRIYGPIFTLWMGSQSTVVVNNLEVFKIAAVKKGIEVAGRSMSSNAYKVLFYKNQNLVCQSYNQKVEVMRKLALSIMKPTSIGGLSIQRIVEEEVEHLLDTMKGVVGKPVDPRNIINLPVSNTIMRSILHFRFCTGEDEDFLHWTKVILDMQLALEKAVLLNFFPFLWYIFPSIRELVTKAGQQYDDFIEKHLTYHEETYQEGVIRDLADAILKYQKGTTEKVEPSQILTRTNVSGIIKDMLGAGTQTTITAVLWCFLNLVRQPHMQERIQQELDTFLKGQTEKEGTNDSRNKPAFNPADRSHLSYTNAFIHEMLRRCSPAPLGLPHKTLTDVSIGGYMIPKDTAVILHNHGCHMDPSLWDSPSEFRPERFLDQNGDFDHSKAKRLVTFGAGTRSCIGENLARMEIFLIIANVLHYFTLSCPSVNNLPTLDQVRYQLECAPLPYKIIFNLRKQS